MQVPRDVIEANANIVRRTENALLFVDPCPPAAAGGIASLL
jgi:hypothetical protein